MSDASQQAAAIAEIKLIVDGVLFIMPKPEEAAKTKSLYGRFSNNDSLLNLAGRIRQILDGIEK